MTDGRRGQNLPQATALRHFCDRFVPQRPIDNSCRFQCGLMTGWYLHSKPKPFQVKGYDYCDFQFKLKPIKDDQKSRDCLILEAIPENEGEKSRFFKFENHEIPDDQYITVPADDRQIQAAKYLKVLAKEISESKVREYFKGFENAKAKR